MDSEQLEKYTSAITLSDMEAFVFPELMLALVLANIMSPVIWRWRELDCFKKLQGKNSYKKLMRLRQFIMDEYEFNLDLETWGLTDKTRELKRFEKFISPDAISKSNALFGYHGDEYYFDVDIRKHFGLDKYDSDIIPYWKTETVEAMNAFVYKEGYKTGAGECVSLSALYAAAAFIVCEIPLEDIFMILTPLHSQNFIDIQDGVLTNNRRLVTKTMWFNGTAISNKAQRALRNENVTVVGHCSGYVHCVYKDATIDINAYGRLKDKLSAYLTAELSIPAVASFLRTYRDYQKYFQLCRDCRGHIRFIKAEALFHYEHNSNYKIADHTHEKLLAEISEEDFHTYELPGRIRCDKLEEFIKKQKIDLQTPQGKNALTDYFAQVISDAKKVTEQLADFIHVDARLPASDKNFVSSEPIKIDVGQSREQIIKYLNEIRSKNITAELAFYAYRDIESCEWEPFIKAATERNPVSIQQFQPKNIKQVYEWLCQIKDESIYEGKRLAQPDEVTNYKTGDGLEKAILLANIIHQRNKEQKIEITVNDDNVKLEAQERFEFKSQKNLKGLILLTNDTITTKSNTSD